MFGDALYEAFLALLSEETRAVTLYPKAVFDFDPEKVECTRRSLVRLAYDDIAVVNLNEGQRRALLHCMRSKESSIRLLAFRVLKNACFYAPYEIAGRSIVPYLGKLASSTSTSEQFVVGDFLTALASQETHQVACIGMLDAWADVLALQYAATDLACCRSLAWAICHEYKESFVSSQLTRHLRPLSLAVRVAQGPTTTFLKNLSQVSPQRSAATFADEQHACMSWGRLLLLVSQRERGFWRVDVERREAQYLLLRSALVAATLLPWIVGVSIMQSALYGPTRPLGSAFVNYAAVRFGVGVCLIGGVVGWTSWRNSVDRWRHSSSRFLRARRYERTVGARIVAVESDAVVAERIVRRKMAAAAVVVGCPLLFRFVVRGMWAPTALTVGVAYWGDCGQFYLRSCESFLHEKEVAATRGENALLGQALHPVREVGRWFDVYLRRSFLGIRVAGWPSRASTVEGSTMEL